MQQQEFLNEIAHLFGRNNWADFSIEENQKLINIFEDIDYDAYSRCLDENINQYTETDVEDAREDGYNSGYDDGLEEGKRNLYNDVYGEALEDYKAGMFENPNEFNCCTNCVHFGSSVNLGWTWCGLQDKHFHGYCEYCRFFEKQPDSITTSTKLTEDN